MTVSMRVMSAGHGYRYLTDSVAIGDGAREAGRPLTDYYTVDGCPPGRWLGSGLAGLDGALRLGEVVTEEQLARLLGEGRDPTSGAALGHAYPRYATRRERIDQRVAVLDVGLPSAARAAAVERIEAEEAARPVRRAVAGYDLTFSAPKSVSVLWALADTDTRQAVEQAHHAAVADVIALVERDVAATRVGANGPDGAVAQVEVAGVIAAAFDHYDSRAGDPQLHTHVVIANKVRTLLDGKWRSLDGRPIHAAMVALSEHYNAVLADHVTTALGVVWEQRDRGRDRNPAWEIAGVPEQLLDVFASRSTAIEVEKDRLVAAYVAEHGRQPSPTVMLRLRQQATLATRPDKHLHSLQTLQARWAATADATGHAPTSWVPHVLQQRAQQRLRDRDLTDATVARIARQVVHVVGERRSTWRRWNLHAEASRQLMGVRFATTTDRDAVLTRIVAAAEAASVRLSPPELAAVPAELQRTDGTSVLRPRHTTVFTSADLLAAEDDLVRLARSTTGPALPALTVAAQTGELGADQATAIATVATSGRVVDVLVGPAGTGKTTTMRNLRQAWTDLYGTGAVIALAPSAAAAEVLGAGLDVPAETLAKWLHSHYAGKTRLHAGQLVIVDEASLAGTRALHQVADAVHRAGAKLLLVGDPGQLAAVDAGGAFDLLVRDRDDVAELTTVRRFHQPWEAAATLQLRNGDPTALDTYAMHDRLRDGDTEQMLDTAYTAWQHDVSTGRSSLLIAPTRDQVTALNLRAQADLLSSGQLDHGRTVTLHDGTTAGTGEVVVTRRNNRRLADSAGRWVRNGDRWTITAVHPDGTILLQPAGQAGRRVQLPAEYVGAHVELGYATTAHRAQGATVDTAHAIITPAMTRETVYVAMTRGRHSNTAYTTTDDSVSERHHDHELVIGRHVLIRTLGRVGAESSAIRQTAMEQDRWDSIAQLTAEYDTIAAAAQHHRWSELIRSSGLTDDQVEQVLRSEALGPLCAALRRAEAYDLDPDQLLPRLVTQRPLHDADDIAAVLHHRLDAAIHHHVRTAQPASPDSIVGLIPAATGPMTPDMHTALQQRQERIQQRAIEVLRTGLETGESWIRHLGPPPHDPARRRTWARHAATVAAYRERYMITTQTLIGPQPYSDTQRIEAAAAINAAHQALAASQTGRLTPASNSRRPPARVYRGPTL